MLQKPSSTGGDASKPTPTIPAPTSVEGHSFVVPFNSRIQQYLEPFDPWDPCGFFAGNPLAKEAFMLAYTPDEPVTELKSTDEPMDTSLDPSDAKLRDRVGDGAIGLGTPSDPADGKKTDAPAPATNRGQSESLPKARSARCRRRYKAKGLAKKQPSRPHPSPAEK